MIKLGKYNTLKAVKKVDFGMYLDGDDLGEVLMPGKYVEENLKVGDSVEVFVYRDSDERPVATTERPLIQVGEAGLLTVKTVASVGAFVDWGVNKDLFVPFREQAVRMEAGGQYVVYAYVDDATKRIVGSTKLNKYIGQRMPRYEDGETVDVLIVKRTDMGYKVIVDNLYWGMVYNNDLFDDVRVGDRINAYVKTVRDDGKIDVTLRESTGNRVFSIARNVLGYLRDNGGEMQLCDSSTPEEIKKAFYCSKKDFKKALGYLLKRQKIVLFDKSTKLK